MNKAWAFSQKHPVSRTARRVPTNGRWLAGLPWSRGDTGKGLSSKSSGPKQMFSLRYENLYLTLRSKHIPPSKALHLSEQPSGSAVRAGGASPLCTHHAPELATCVRLYAIQVPSDSQQDFNVESCETAFPKRKWLWLHIREFGIKDFTQPCILWKEPALAPEFPGPKDPAP